MQPKHSHDTAILAPPAWYERAWWQDAGGRPQSIVRDAAFAIRNQLVRLTFRALCQAARILNRFAPEKVVAAITEELSARPVCLTSAAARLHQPEALLVERCAGNHLALSIEELRRDSPSSTLYIVSDRLSGSWMGVPVIASANVVTSRLATSNDVVFLCVFNSDERLLSELRVIRQFPNARYVMPGRFAPASRYFHQNDLAATVLAEQSRLPLGKFDLSDFENLLQAVEATRNLPGDYVEVGVFQGRSANCVLSYMDRAKISKPAWFLDIFEGFTYKEAFTSQDTVWRGSHQDTSFDAVNSLLGPYRNATVLKTNIITDELPDAVREISTCNIDVDMYEAVKAGADKLAPRVVAGGIMIFEDAGHTPPLGGARLAVDDFLKTPAGRDFVPIYMQSGQMFLIRFTGGTGAAHQVA
jgi:hypothetical protein